MSPAFLGNCVPTMIYESQNQKMVIFNIFVRKKNEYVMKQSIQFNVCMHHGLV